MVVTSIEMPFREGVPLNAIATAHNTARAKSRWFEEGEQNRIYPEHVAQVMDYFGRKAKTKDFGADQPWKIRRGPD